MLGVGHWGDVIITEMKSEPKGEEKEMMLDDATFTEVEMDNLAALCKPREKPEITLESIAKHCIDDNITTPQLEYLLAAQAELARLRGIEAAIRECPTTTTEHGFKSLVYTTQLRDALEPK